ncbi:hypothetical protein A2303_05635 [Candidatus Falkowbacteria bacterium RIFOXYB2_FULL_47_14]|uniref:CxxC-x17-CxxC domain-containing protein n=1 Tax=Candidatus Falkowbacteria bacterium RIFOXYA2_FULL_47_19 TaxID=1797994 RepID=A0A1F5SEC6_9BACT|nr:MAG: hypothetical protein A2227_07035 [Candidatus Falkowbacteria bacterium RIFOXYA2_FULL_47_19]OGF35326.1 MAG: hypothetical protein A2468_00185 [Candidatus Falkowbacteria bacterium RIFOXYC2_FULL_46_15]OGF43767.1 MAG: hypothetical protein A2303_05635 [Candidatus Falkowbacteria bacterium RIFOXYB2_FULL_47_14]
MGKFNKGEKFGGKKRFDGDHGFRGGNNRERPQMHDAICAECGRQCEVPFRPSGDKPVYCSDCFGKKDNSGGGRFERKDSGRSGFGNKQMFKAVCDKCHRDCEVPFRPTGDKPVYCSDCFGKSEKAGGSGGQAGADQYKKQFEALNNKLDSIIKILSLNFSAEKTVKEKPVTHVIEKIAEKKNGKKIKPKKKEILKKIKKAITPKKAAHKKGKK